MVNVNPSAEDIIRKYGSKIESQIKTNSMENINFSRVYTQFKDEMAPNLSRYEKWCKSFGNLIKIKVSQKDEAKFSKFLTIAHLDVEPWQVASLSIITFIGVFMVGLLLSVGVSMFNGGFSNFPFLFFFLVVILALFLFYFMNAYPQRLANKWRLKASSQMVPAILYVVVYMRHTSNLEKAIAFASEHLQYPLALDFKKVFYDVEVRKYSTIKDSLDAYLETWRDYSTEFIESFHLIESSLFEPDNNRRIITLDKSLQVVLDGVYDKMLKFTHNVRSPLTNVYMLGVVLPTLALALLPLASAMLGGIIVWYHVMLLFNLIVPFLVFYLTDKIMLLRPGGHGETDLLERNPMYYKYKSKDAYFTGFIILLPFLILGFLPLIFHYTPFPDMLGLQNDYTFSELGLTFFGDDYIFDFKESDFGTSTGPFGFGALILSLFIPLGLALSLSHVYKTRTKDLIVERDKTRQLEMEFNNSLFQLGNRIGNGVPAELVFSRVAESSRGLMTEDFLRRVNYNIAQMGMSVENAIFDKQRGAILYYPSELIATSMKILIESSKKGLSIAATSLMSISQYVKNIQKITIRLKDMLAEIVSDMKSNMTFLAPLLSGIVVGLAAMIASILGKLNLSDLASEGAIGVGSLSTVLEIFNMSSMLPAYYLQIIVGIYLIQVIFILTGTLVSINSGEDKLEKMYTTGRNFKRGMILYFITALIATVSLFVLTSVVLGGLMG